MATLCFYWNWLHDFFTKFLLRLHVCFLNHLTFKYFWVLIFFKSLKFPCRLMSSIWKSIRKLKATISVLHFIHFPLNFTNYSITLPTCVPCMPVHWSLLSIAMGRSIWKFIAKVNVYVKALVSFFQTRWCS